MKKISKQNVSDNESNINPDTKILITYSIYNEKIIRYNTNSFTKISQPINSVNLHEHLRHVLQPRNTTYHSSD